MLGAEPVEEALDPERVRVAEGAGVAHVPADRLAAVLVADRAEPLADLVERRLPGDALEAPVGAAALRMQDPVGVVLDLGHRDPLRAREAARERVLLVGPELRHPPVLDRRDHPAERLADPAVGDLLLCAQRASGPEPTPRSAARPSRSPRPGRGPRGPRSSRRAGAAIRSDECAATAASFSSLPVSVSVGGVAAGRGGEGLDPGLGVHGTPTLHHSGTSLVAVAFQLASTRDPGAQPEPRDRRRRHLGHQRLGRGEADPRPVPELGHRPRPRREVVERRPLAPASGAPSSISQGKTLAATGPRRASVLVTLAAPVQRDLGQPAGARARLAAQDDRAGEVGDERRGRRRGELGRRPALDDPAAVEDRDPVGEQRRLGEVVGDDRRPASASRRGAGRAPPTRPRACGRRARRAARRGAGAAGSAAERPSEGDALALAARELAGPRVGPLGEAEALEQLERAAAALAPRAADPVGDVAPAPTSAGTARSPGRRSRRGAPRPARLTPAAESSQASSPSVDAAGASGAGSPAIARSSVLLPAPEGPTSARRSPGPTDTAASSAKPSRSISRVATSQRRQHGPPPGGRRAA